MVKATRIIDNIKIFKNITYSFLIWEEAPGTICPGKLPSYLFPNNKFTKLLISNVMLFFK